jgi:hypothetical protein
MRKSRSPLFLERQSYRQRRVRDAARMMPFLGTILWGVPILWAGPGPHGVSTSKAMLYIFGVWLALSLVSLVITLWLQPDSDADPSEGG